MAIIPRGSYALSGYGDAPMKFLSQTGTELALDGAPPKIGRVDHEDGCNGLYAFASGGYLAISTFAPSGPFSANYVMDKTFVYTGGAGNTNGNASGRTVGDHGYIIEITVPGGIWTYTLKKIDRTGSVLASWVFLTDPLLHDFESIAVSLDEATLYYAYDVPGTSGRPNVVYAYNLNTSTLIGAFASEPGAYTYENCIMALPNGDVIIGWGRGADSVTRSVKRYNSSGVLQASYSPPGYRNALSIVPNVNTTVSPATDDFTSFVMNYYDNGGGYGVGFATINVATGVVSNYFHPPDIGFEWDGPMCLMRELIGHPATSTPSPTPLGPAAPCNPQAQVSGVVKGQFGCNTGGIAR